MRKYKIIDISVPLSKNTVIYPGNAPVSVELWSKLSKGKNRLSKIVMGSHSGTHIDAPAHCLKGGKEIADIPLQVFVGPCRVLDFSDEGLEITEKSLRQKKIKKGERILAKTKNSEIGFKKFRNDYIYLSGDGADYLAKLDISLFGIDYFSVKQRGSSDHRPHDSLLKKDIPIIEGLDLRDIGEGDYFLIAPPLKFVSIEGSPCRAILLK